MDQKQGAPTPAAMGLVSAAIKNWGGSATSLTGLGHIARKIDEDRMFVFTVLMTHMDALMKNAPHIELPVVHSALNHSFTVLVRALQRHWGIHEELEPEKEDGDGEDGQKLPVG